MVVKLYPVNDVRATFPDSTQRTVDIRWTATAEVWPNHWRLPRAAGARRVKHRRMRLAPCTIAHVGGTRGHPCPVRDRHHVVTALFANRATSGTSATVVVPPCARIAFVVAAEMPDPVAATADPPSITAFDGYGIVDTHLTGDQCLTFGGGLQCPHAYLSRPRPRPGLVLVGLRASFASGPATPGVALFGVASTTLTVTYSTGGSGQDTIDATPAAVRGLTSRDCRWTPHRPSSRGAVVPWRRSRACPPAGYPITRSAER